MDEQGFVAAFDRVESLQPNWDAEGAPAIRPEILLAAREFIGRIPRDEMPELPRVQPSADGCLQFEWGRFMRFLEMELRSPDTIQYLKFDGEASMEHEGTFDIEDTDAAVSLLRWFRKEEQL